MGICTSRGQFAVILPVLLSSYSDGRRQLFWSEHGVPIINAVEILQVVNLVGWKPTFILVISRVNVLFEVGLRSLQSSVMLWFSVIQAPC